MCCFLSVLRVSIISSLLFFSYSKVFNLFCLFFFCVFSYKIKLQTFFYRTEAAAAVRCSINLMSMVYFSRFYSLLFSRQTIILMNQHLSAVNLWAHFVFCYLLISFCIVFRLCSSPPPLLCNNFYEFILFRGELVCDNNQRMRVGDKM